MDTPAPESPSGYGTHWIRDGMAPGQDGVIFAEDKLVLIPSDIRRKLDIHSRTDLSKESEPLVHADLKMQYKITSFEGSSITREGLRQGIWLDANVDREYPSWPLMYLFNIPAGKMNVSVRAVNIRTGATSNDDDKAPNATLRILVRPGGN